MSATTGTTADGGAPPNPYCHYFTDAAFEETDRPGFRRRVISGEHMELWFWRIAGGATGSFLHRHLDNEQFGIVVRGALDFRIGDPDDERRVVLRAGEIYNAPRGVPHGDSVFVGDDEYDECWIIDVFSPPRADGAQPGSIDPGLDDAAGAGPDAGPGRGANGDG